MVIIPAAGYGQRVGFPEAKELFLHPTRKIPLIDIALERAREWNQKIHVITRKEKKSLIDYLAQYSDVSIQIIEPSKEWSDTILKSMEFWEDQNLVLLPDSDFECDFNPVNLFHAYEIIFGVFPVVSGKSWGMVKADGTEKYVVEKKDEVGLAWGLFGFKKDRGEILLGSILESHYDHQWKTLKAKTHFFKIENYVDFTR